MTNYESRLTKLKDVERIQSSEGNFDQSEYMRGLANGIILAVHIMTDAEGEPPYKEEGIKK